MIYSTWSLAIKEFLLQPALEMENFTKGNVIYETEHSEDTFSFAIQLRLVRNLPTKRHE